MEPSSRYLLSEHDCPTCAVHTYIAGDARGEVIVCPECQMANIVQAKRTKLYLVTSLVLVTSDMPVTSAVPVTWVARTAQDESEITPEGLAPLTCDCPVKTAQPDLPDLPGSTPLHD